jgi:starch-binding outer membrane protein, SusD/RagB family
MYKKEFPILSLAFALILSFTACKKWVVVDPPLQVGENELLSDEQGFRDVLNGVYLHMGTRSLYGRDMTFGMMSVLGRSYDTTISPVIDNLFYQSARYNFQDASMKTTQKNIWDSLYFSIGNLNNLLANVESRKDVFSGNNYNTIKGETLGLRAFIHFDLLRMFAPSPAAAGFNVAAIPYVTRMSPYPTAVITTGAFIDSCIADLKNAEVLLNDADKTTSRFTGWALKGLLSRIYLYKGDYANAQSNALSVINSNKFPLSVSNSDLMFSKEHLFSLLSSSSISLTYYKSVLNTVPPLGFTTQNQTALFVTGSGATSDWRRSFVDPATGTALGNTISPRKFYSTTTTSPNILPLIRTTEMYYIAAECATVLNDSLTATNLLNTVRIHRNLPKYTLTALKKDSLGVEIAKEYQKEYLGEGQVFFYYKRKNIPFAAFPYTKVSVVPNASYVFIKPE